MCECQVFKKGEEEEHSAFRAANTSAELYVVGYWTIHQAGKTYSSLRD